MTQDDQDRNSSIAHELKLEAERYAATVSSVMGATPSGPMVRLAIKLAFQAGAVSAIERLGKAL